MKPRTRTAWLPAGRCAPRWRKERGGSEDEALCFDPAGHAAVHGFRRWIRRGRSRGRAVCFLHKRKRTDVLTFTADDGVISGLAGCGGFRRRDRNPLCGRTGCDQRESLRPLCARRGRRAVRSADPVRAGGLRGGINRNEMAAAAVLNGLVPPFDCIGKAIG